MKNIENIINNISKWSGELGSYIILVLIVVVVYSVIARYIFNNPPVWSYDLSTELFGAFILLGGAYVVLKNSLLNVDLLWKRFPPRIGATLSVVTYLLGFGFLGTMLWKAIPQAILSTKILEKSADLTLYIFPIRIMFVIGSFLFLLQLVVSYGNMLKTALGKRKP